MGFLILFALYVVGVYWLLMSLPAIFAAIGIILSFVWECVVTSFVYAGWALRWVLWAVFAALVGAGRWTAYFTVFVFYELWVAWRDRNKAEEPQDEQQQTASAHGVMDEFERACRVLGLAANFTAAEFKQAYRAAMRKAHPDASGSTQAAQAVNAARDIIRRKKGWA